LGQAKLIKLNDDYAPILETKKPENGRS